MYVPIVDHHGAIGRQHIDGEFGIEIGGYAGIDSRPSYLFYEMNRKRESSSE